MAVTYIFNTQGGGIAFMGDSLYENAYRMVGQKYDISAVSMAMGNNAPGYTDKMSPWDLWRIAEALEVDVILPMHMDNWANCWEDPAYLEDIVQRKNKEKIHHPLDVVTLRPGARYIHPDDRHIGRYCYPDNREMTDWRESTEYGPKSGK